MAFCSYCGNNVSEGAKHCPNCGAALEEERTNTAESTIDDVAAKIKNLNNTKDESANYSKDDASGNMLMGILCYLSFLVFIPIFAEKDSKFVRFHANQGLVMFVCSLAVSVAEFILGKLLGGIFLIGFLYSVITWVIGVLFFILMVVGIVNVVSGKAKELPVIGGIRLLK